jgi:hypothetical protein
MRLLVLGSAALGAAALASAAPPARPHTIAAWLPPDSLPTEPATRTLSPDEAGAVLERDWIFQCDGRPSPGAVEAEIRRTQRIAKGLADGPSRFDASATLQRLSEIEASVKKPSAAPSRSPRPAGIAGRWSFEGTDDEVSAFRPLGSWVFVDGVFANGVTLGGGAHANAGAEANGVFAGPYSMTAWIRTQSDEADVIGTGVGRDHVLLMAYRGVVRGHHWTDGGANVIDGRTPVADGGWHHIAMVVDGAQIRIYVDGRVDAELAFKGHPGVPLSPLVIGARSMDPSSLRSRFQGSMDEILVVGRALGADEIAGLHAAGRAALEAAAGAAREPYLTVRRIKRDLMFRDPAVDFDRVVFIDQPYPRGAEWAHEARHRNGTMAVPGGRLLTLEGLHPGGTLRKLAPADGPASFWRPDVSFDGRRVLFCMKPTAEKAFHLYEVGADGKGLRQITRGDYDDLDPIYLPDGHVLFSTMRANTYVRCMPYTYAYVLARCDGDGKNLYVVSPGNEPDWLPSLLHDGRVVFTRWEYTDKALWRIQSLWTMNPDGTGLSAFWGNQSVWPDMLVEPRAIPGSRRVMFTGAGHHDWFAGPIGIVDPAQGFNFPDGLAKVTADVPWAECGPPPVDPVESAAYEPAGRFGAYKTPYPLSDRLFLVSARTGGLNTPRDKSPGAFKLYLMDIDGNRELVYEGAFNILHAMPLRPRPVPPRIADRVEWPGTGPDRKPAAPGVLFSGDVLQGPTRIPPGEAKWLRVVAMDAKTYSSWIRDEMPHQHSGPTISLLQADGVKRIASEVPVEADGSVNFEAPPGVALHFQLLDAERRAIQTMRSFVGVMPGERRGCVGCHEMHSVAQANARGTALDRAPSKPAPPPWGADTTLGYERSIQPILEKHCGACHLGEGKGRKAFDLTLRPGLGVFKEPYVTLVGGSLYHGPKSLEPAPSIAGCLPVETWPTAGAPEGVRTFPPMTYMSRTSRLVNHYAPGGHRAEVKMPDADRRVLAAWVDLTAPYRGAEEIRELPDPDFPGIEDLPIRPRVRTAPDIDRFNLPQDGAVPEPQRDAAP